MAQDGSFFPYIVLLIVHKEARNPESLDDIVSELSEQSQVHDKLTCIMIVAILLTPLDTLAPRGVQKAREAFGAARSAKQAYRQVHQGLRRQCRVR
jgi:hypothetical protein